MRARTVNALSYLEQRQLVTTVLGSSKFRILLKIKPKVKNLLALVQSCVLQATMQDCVLQRATL